MCREGVMLQPQWDSTNSHQLRMQLYTPGHELKAMAARHIHPCFRERPWRLSWVVLKCTTANLLIQHTAKWGAGLGWGKRAHAGLVREDETSEYHTERYTSVEKWPAVALPEQMTVSQISLDRLRARLSEISWYWCHVFQSQIRSSVSE